MNFISKIKVLDVIYHLRDLRLPTATSTDKDKVVGVDANGNYILTNATSGGVINIDAAAHRILCISGIDISGHTIVVA